MIKKWFIILSELEKIFDLFSNSIDREIIMQGRMIFQKTFKYYLKNKWLWCWEQIWFDKGDTLHVQMFKSGHYWWREW